MRVNKKPFLVWDQCDIFEAEVKCRLESMDENERKELDEELDITEETAEWRAEEKREERIGRDVSNDSDLFQFEWECLTDNLTELMEKVNPNGYWKVTVNNFGWMHQDGYKTFKADKGKELLREVLPNTDCTFSIYKADHNRLVINNAHHDAPMGGEMYYISPMSCDKYYESRL